MTEHTNEWTLDGFVEHFDFVHHKMPDHRFVWVLGAGASCASGIPLASQLVDSWLDELHLREEGRLAPLEQWATAENLGIEGFTYRDRASFYPKVYHRRFRNYPDEGYAYLESVMSGKDPSPGYSILAAALAADPPRHNAVITTNFDNMIADALSVYTDTFPFVCGHESLAGFVQVAMRRPLICKIHRDLLLSPQNDPRSLQRLHDAWGMALRALFKHYTPLVIGYGGNDDTLMDLLGSHQPGDINGQMVWCFHADSRPSDRIVNVVTQNQGVLVAVPDFDLLMVLLGERMGISLLDEEIGRRAQERTKRYRDRIQQLDTVKHPTVTRALAATLARSGGWWVWEQKARLETNIERRETVYRQGLDQCPQSPELHDAFAIFLWQKRGEYDEAERLLRRAIELSPNQGRYYASLGSFLTHVRQQYDDAEKLYRKALDLDSKNATHILEFARFQANVRHDNQEAERLFRKARDVSPRDPNVNNSFAQFLMQEPSNSEYAEELYREAFEVAPTNPKCACELAFFLWNVRGDHDKAEYLYRKAIELDPSNADSACHYAAFLWVVRRDLAEAEHLYRKAVNLDPSNAAHVGSLATFLANVADNHDEIEQLFQRAIDLDPRDARQLANYVAFLLACGRMEESVAKLKQARLLNERQLNQLAAELALYDGIIAAAILHDDTPLIEEVLEILETKFHRHLAIFDAVLAFSRENLAPEKHEIYSNLAAAIQNPGRVTSILFQRLPSPASASETKGSRPTLKRRAKKPASH